MKKIVIIMLIVLAGSTTALSDDYTYPYLVIQSADGSTASISVSSLTLTVADGKLVVTNGEGTQQLTLSDLLKMYFSTSPTAISMSTASQDQSVEVFTMAGVRIGQYDTVDKARTSVRSGIYVMKSKNRTFKVVIK